METLTLFSILFSTFSFAQPYANNHNVAMVKNTLETAGIPPPKHIETLGMETAEEVPVDMLQILGDVLDRGKRELDGADLRSFEDTPNEDSLERDAVVENIIDGVVDSFIPALDNFGPVINSLLKPALSRFGGTLGDGAFGIAQDLLTKWNILNPDTESTYEAHPVYILNKGSFILLTNIGLPEARKVDTANHTKNITNRQSRDLNTTKYMFDKFGHPNNIVGDNDTHFIVDNHVTVTNKNNYNDTNKYISTSSTNSNESNIYFRKEISLEKDDKSLINPTAQNEKQHNDVNNTQQEIRETNISLIPVSLKDNKTYDYVSSTEQKGKFIINDTVNMIENNNVIFKNSTTHLTIAKENLEPRDGNIILSDNNSYRHRSNANYSNFSNIMKIHGHVNIQNLTTEKSFSDNVNTTEDINMHVPIKEEEFAYSTPSEEEVAPYVKNTELPDREGKKSIYLGGVHLIPLPEDIMFEQNVSFSDKSVEVVKEAIKDIVESQDIVKRMKRKLMLILIKKMEDSTAALKRRMNID